MAKHRTTRTKRSKPQAEQGYQPPPPGAAQGYLEGSRAADASGLDDTIQRWQSLKTDAAMATFAERWVSLTASQFERTWPVLYQMLKFIEEHEIYKDKTKTSDHKTHENFQSYFEAKVRQQFAVWSDMEVAYHFAVDHCPELLAKAFSEAKAYILQKNGGDRKSELYYNTDFGDPLPERGTAASYLTARLARDRPDILDQLKAGAYKSVRAAAIAAGIVQPTTPLQYVQTGWRKAAIEDKKKIVVWIQDQLQNDPELLGNIG